MIESYVPTSSGSIFSQRIFTCKSRSARPVKNYKGLIDKALQARKKLKTWFNELMKLFKIKYSMLKLYIEGMYLTVNNDDDKA